VGDSALGQAHVSDGALGQAHVSAFV
jgi:hypothetical protein